MRVAVFQGPGDIDEFKDRLRFIVCEYCYIEAS